VTRLSLIENYLKQGLEDALIEFETIKNVLIVALPVALILSASFYFSNSQIPKNVLTNKAAAEYFLSLTYELANLLGPITGAAVGSFIVYFRIIITKESRFYLSKACFRIALDKEDIFKQMHYFGEGLQEYNKYLGRHLKRQIRGIDKVFSKVGILDNVPRSEIIHSLSNSFQVETDRLKPLKYISAELMPMLMEPKDIEGFLVPESLRTRLKVGGTLLAASIPIVISIITLIVTIISPHK